MRYRIKIITFKTGRKEFHPQFKKGLFWINIVYDGSLEIAFPSRCEFRETALSLIDKHFGGNAKRQTIEFEYITK